MNKTLILAVLLILLISLATAHKKGRKSRKACKYKVGEWSECDESGMQQRTLTHRRGSAKQCPDKVIKKECREVSWAQMKRKEKKLGCEYSKGSWGLCNNTSNLRARVETLIDQTLTEKGCRSERVLEKPCKFACRYTHGEWSNCNKTTNQRTRELALIEGSPTDCAQSEIKTRKCLNVKGREKCFFGTWSTYSECVNGEVTRTREVLAGGRRCRKRASQSKKCTVATAA
ncbi:uncharacterized protein LOC117104956 [Anneissia japonica]|uniref:uncharacterized protein LOC117104956 n=1 Tax=Anneissia japonica TaxID=1529436 RepID=UPI0014256D98|nr:uncharacterized protein LOC117104956 [Anneissia japonica]